MGISTDSYAATVGSRGEFTGCIAHLGYVLFFKENVIHKLYGDRPANFQLADTNCRGIQKGSEKSAVIVNETLYYKAVRDVCAYQASLPASISQALGGNTYANAVAGSYGGKYYISMQETNGQYSLFVYDTNRGFWHREDETQVKWFASLDGELYYIDAKDNGLYSVGGSLPAKYMDGAAGLEKDVCWSCETGDIGLNMPDAKFVSRIRLRLEVKQDAIVRVATRYPGEEWKEVARISLSQKRSVTLPILPRRCDTMRLRISGEGEARIYSLSKNIEQGSDE